MAGQSLLGEGQVEQIDPSSRGNNRRAMQEAAGCRILDAMAQELVATDQTTDEHQS